MSTASGFQQLDRLFRPSRSGNAKFLSALLVVGHKEFLKLGQQRLADLINRREVFVVVGVDRRPKQSIIGLFLAVLNLFSRDDADQAYLDDAADVRRGVP